MRKFLLYVRLIFVLLSSVITAPLCAAWATLGFFIELSIWNLDNEFNNSFGLKPIIIMVIKPVYETYKEIKEC